MEFSCLWPALSAVALHFGTPGPRHENADQHYLGGKRAGSACGVQLQSSCNYSTRRNTIYMRHQKPCHVFFLCAGISVPYTTFCGLLGIGLSYGHRTVTTACAELQSKGLHKYIGCLLPQIPWHASR
ncbi:hypothetical protein CORC01_01237 [Colletotrichum orchidophilum]|uniref:Uncharacterized protein n=1 Tax=Colletotrichum orchidophilum TaxID=1209926 RepID=A0A1G4BQC5_9PEZI|nr:uncharacterized protein CORC01_01237 [Colletotrichum orchidophilum]OHF03518.1 hypothetical protein CORC01_01237 [Colletotrichum orchidophilum]